MPLSAAERKKRSEATPSESFIRKRLGSLHEIGIPSAFTNTYKDRINACKTKEEVVKLIDLMRHTYFERNFNR